MTLTFDLKINRGPPGVTLNTCVKNHHCMPKGNGVIKQKRRKTNCKKFKVQITLIFILLTPNRERFFSGHGQYICEVSLLFAKSKWSCGAETVKKLKVQIRPLNFRPKINRGPPRVKVNIYVNVKYKRTDAVSLWHQK